MKVFSGEVAFKASELYGKIAKTIRGKLNKFETMDSQDNTYGTEFENIGIITMILGEGLEGTTERKLVRHKKRMQILD